MTPSQNLVSGAYSPNASNLISSVARKPTIPAYNPNTMGMSKAPVHPQGTPKSSTITTTSPMGDTTVHKQEYQTNTPATSTPGTNPGLMSQLADAQKKLKEAQDAGYSGNTQIQKDASGNVIPANASTNPNNNNFGSYVANVGSASGNAVNSGQEQIQKSSKGLYDTQSNPQQSTQDYQNTLKGISTDQTPEVKRAQQEYNTFSKASPMLLADVANNPNVAAEVSVGRGAQLGQVLSGEQQALQGNVANALQGEGQQITAANEAGGLANTAQGQGITAGTNVLNAGTTQQGQGITGLENAGTLSKGTPTAQGQTTYDPLTNSFKGGSYPDNLNTIVNAIKNNQIGYSAGVDSLSGLSPTAKADVLKALGPGFDTIASDAQATARGSNIGTAGTATTNANKDVYNQAVSDFANTNQAVQNVDKFGKILMDPSQNGGINPTDAKLANQKWADVKSQFSSATQAKFDSTLTALQQKIGDLLQAGGSGTPGQLSSDAKQILDGSATLGTIGATLDRIGAEGVVLQKALEDKKNTAYQAMQGGSNSNSSGSTGGTWNDIFEKQYGYSKPTNTI